jgi:hypothetical protein
MEKVLHSNPTGLVEGCHGEIMERIRLARQVESSGASATHGGGGDEGGEVVAHRLLIEVVAMKVYLFDLGDEVHQQSAINYARFALNLSRRFDVELCIDCLHLEICDLEPAYEIREKLWFYGFGCCWHGA